MSLHGMVGARGALLVFTLVSPGGHDPTTGLHAEPTTTEVSCYALEQPGDARTYQALNLVEANPVTLTIVPLTPGGELPSLGYAAAWGGVTRVVRSIERIVPRGSVAAGATVILAS